MYLTIALQSLHGDHCLCKSVFFIKQLFILPLSFTKKLTTLKLFLSIIVKVIERTLGTPWEHAIEIKRLKLLFTMCPMAMH